MNDFRSTHESLRQGRFRPVLHDADRHVLSFARTMPGDEVIVLVNYGREEQNVTLPSGRPGQMIEILSPNLENVAPELEKPDAPKQSLPPLFTAPRLSVIADRQVVSNRGGIDLLIKPMAVRLILISDKESK